MPATAVRTLIDHAAIDKGDVIVAKHIIPTPAGLHSICTRCEAVFKTSYRRMAPLARRGHRSCEVRSVPQCPGCRGRYVKRQKSNPSKEVRS